MENIAGIPQLYRKRRNPEVPAEIHGFEDRATVLRAENALPNEQPDARKREPHGCFVFTFLTRVLENLPASWQCFPSADLLDCRGVS
jgi:hypothetical protein